MAAIYNEDERIRKLRKETKKGIEKIGFSFEGYKDEIIKKFLDFFIEMKDGVEIRLVSGRNENGKSPNYRLMDYLLNPRMDDSINELLNYIYNEKIRDKRNERNKYMFLDQRLAPFPIEYKKVKTLGIKSYTEELVPSVRNFIRNHIITHENLEKIEFYKDERGKVKYEEKIRILKQFLSKSDLYYQKQLWIAAGSNLTKNFLEELYLIKQHQMILSEVINQLIIYDILLIENENLRKNKKVKIVSILDETLLYLSTFKKNYGDIYEDFFSFIYLQEQVKKWQRQEIIQSEIIENESVKNKIINSEENDNKVSKEEIIKYFIAQKEESTEFCGVNFENIPEIKKIIDEKKGYFISKDEIKQDEKFGGKNIYDKKINVSRVIYGNKKIKNNYDDELGALELVLNKFPYLKGDNLQVLKVIVDELENSSIVIGEERKKIKTIIMEYYKSKNKKSNKGDFKPKELSLEVISYIREKITRGMYNEKGFGNEYYFSHIYQKKITSIFEKINTISNKEEIERLCYLVSKNILNEIEEINKHVTFIPKEIGS